MQRAWTLIVRERMKDKSFGGLNVGLDDCADRLFPETRLVWENVYGQYDILCGVEWDDSRERLHSILDSIADAGGTPSVPSLIHETVTLVVNGEAAVSSAGWTIVASTWNDGYVLAIGTRCFPGKAGDVQSSLIAQLGELSLNGAFCVDLVTGMFDILIAIVFDDNNLAQLRPALDLLRKIPHIRTTETMLSGSLLAKLANWPDTSYHLNDKD